MHGNSYNIQWNLEVLHLFIWFSRLICINEDNCIDKESLDYTLDPRINLFENINIKYKKYSFSTKTKTQA